MAELRDYQATALERVRDAARRGVKRMMLQMPTAAGKTRVAAEIVNGARSKGKRVIVTVPALSLIDQTVEMFDAEGIRDVGVIQAHHHMEDWKQPVQIASVQTLMRRTIPNADLVIRDEAHLLFKFDLQWMRIPSWENVPFIGLSATPWTKGLGRHYSELIVGTTSAQLIVDGWLSPYRVFAPSHPDLHDVKITMGDFHEGELSQAMNREPLTADAVDTWRKQAEGRPTVCFAVDCAHARALRDKFNDGGVRAGYMDARTPTNERAQIRDQFASGALQVVCSVDVIGIGIDWPDIACVSYCRPTRSEIRYVQNIGRGLRLCEGKDDLLILDHSDTTLRLGFVDDIHHETLSKGRERVGNGEKPKPLPRECKQCHMLRPPFTSVCPNCGFKSEIPISRIRHANGELVEYTHGLPEYKGKKEKFDMNDKRQFYAELLGYAIEYGYKQGWAFYAYKHKFEIEPWGMKDVLPQTPCAKMRTWIKHYHIFKAMQREKQNGIKTY